jgi:hypothetical protein
LSEYGGNSTVRVALEREPSKLSQAVDDEIEFVASFLTGLYLPREVFFGRLGFAGAFAPVCASDFGRFFPATSGSFRLICSG